MRCCVFLAFNSVAPAELVKGPKDYIFLLKNCVALQLPLEPFIG